MHKKINYNESGQVSKILIILAAILLVVIIVVYVVVRLSANKPQVKEPENNEVVNPTEPPKPVYELNLGDIKFVLQSSEDLGNILLKKSSHQTDLKTTERFIKVVIGAQNKGKNSIKKGAWDLGNIIDSDGRSFVSINDKAHNWLPKPNPCGAELKPEFEPIPCTKYYEVSKISKGLKVMVKISEPKKQEASIDLAL